MTPKPSPTMLQKLRRTCDDLARARNLSPEQAEEVYGHMEDKALAYLAGDEKLSEEDVALLVLEHFGNPEDLDAVLGRATGGYHGLWDALSRASLTGGPTDLWGVLHFPWYGPNIALHPLAWLLLGAVAFLVLLLLRTLAGSPIPWWVLATVAVAGLAACVVTFLMYRVVATKLTRKRALLRRHVDMETEGILVRGMTESPAIVQGYDRLIVVTPLLGEQLRIAPAEIRAVRQSHFFNGTLYMGDNGAIALGVEGHPERIAVVLPRPGRWMELLPSALPREPAPQAR